MSFNYGESQWPPAAGAGYDVGAGGAGAQAWDHQTPPTRSGASSVNPREEPSAFFYQFQQVEKAWSEMIKSGKIQPGMGMPPGGRQPRLPGGPAGRPHSPGFAGRGGVPGHPSSNLQNFYASQRHQSSRGSNDAEQMQQHKRRLAAQRERELRNYHQEQQFNRTTAYPPGPQEVNAGPVNSNLTRPDRTFSPGSSSGTAEVPHHELIARQHSALQGKGPFSDTAGYIDENGVPRQGLPIHHHANNMRGPSPLTYEYGRNNNAVPAQQHQQETIMTGSQQLPDPPRDRTSSNASPQSNPPAAGARGVALLEQVNNRTSNSSPGSGSPQNSGGGKASGGKTVVAPIGTRPSAQGSTAGINHPTEQSTTPLGYSAAAAPTSSTAAPSSASAATASTAEGGASSLSSVGNWGQRSGGPWGSSKTQTSVWG
ncbi:unnamed protein product [Discula destructiva]